MPVIDVIFTDLQRLIGVPLPKGRDALNDLLAYVKGEAERLEGDALSIEIKDGNRPDLWSVEGIARELRGVIGVEDGLREYAVTGYSGVRIDVDPRLETVRPYIGASVVKQVRLTDDVIRELMHLQDKLDQTYGRRRRRASIGLYNYRLIKPPLTYKVTRPEDVRFVPLGGTEELDLREIVATHPKGIEYGHLVTKHERWPLLLDAVEKVLSIPPIINSNDLGRITEGVMDILVEVTGTTPQTVLNTLTIVTLSLADRGEAIYSTEIHYPYGENRQVSTPELATHVVRLDVNQVHRVLGANLTADAVLTLLKRARYDARRVGEDALEATVPCYRIDVIHPADVIEDIAIMLGYNNLEPRWPQQITIGAISAVEAFSDVTREIMIGLGFQGILSFSLINEERLFTQMNVKDTPVVEIANPTSSRFTLIRNWLMPSLMDFLSNNTHVEYPQRVFEVGDCVVLDDASETGARTVRKLAGLIAHSNASFSEAKAVVDAFFLNIGFLYRLNEAAHPSFIDGRVGNIVVHDRDVGVVGEVHPRVLEMWGLENPVTGFEVDLSSLMDI